MAVAGRVLRIGAVAGMALALGGCLAVPDGITPVTGFEAERYTGTWYEIARFDYVFERGLRNVRATYSLNEDGTVRVFNHGVDEDTCVPREREGSARFIGSPDVASLAVSFFGNIGAGYHVFYLDSRYQTALVSGSSRDYLWILSRTPTIDDGTLSRLLSTAEDAGFDLDALIMVDQSATCTPRA
ncbi:MAG: lipocalin family protein [Bauldia sp.]|nr:lipocalin family protein [Bauldia sp.]